MSTHQKNLTRITQDDLEKAIKKHVMFGKGRVGGSRAILTYHDLSGLDMHGAPFTGADFTGSLLTGCDMRHANFDGATFFATNMLNAKCANSTFVRADMRGCNITGADFTDSDLSSADLREGAIATKDRRGNINLRPQAGSDNRDLQTEHGDVVIANEATFTRTKMVKCQLRGANMAGAIITDTDLSLSHMQGVNLRGAVICRTNMEGVETADIDMRDTLRDEVQGLGLQDALMPLDMLIKFHRRWVDSQGADGKRLDFTRYDLRDTATHKVDFTDQYLMMMKARHAVFLGLNFNGAQMQACELRDSDLRLCSFNQTDIRGSDFSGSNLMRASFQLAVMGPLRLHAGKLLRTDLSKCNLRYADFSGTDLRQVNMQGADLSFADLSGANLEGADMSDAITENTRF
jgi:uncharacterized protein YjbI with pentapeptide repeats